MAGITQFYGLENNEDNIQYILQYLGYDTQKIQDRIGAKIMHAWLCNNSLYHSGDILKPVPNNLGEYYTDPIDGLEDLNRLSTHNQINEILYFYAIEYAFNIN